MSTPFYSFQSQPVPETIERVAFVLTFEEGFVEETQEAFDEYHILPGLGAAFESALRSGLFRDGVPDPLAKVTAQIAPGHRATLTIEGQGFHRDGMLALAHMLYTDLGGEGGTLERIAYEGQPSGWGEAARPVAFIRRSHVPVVISDENEEGLVVKPEDVLTLRELSFEIGQPITSSDEEEGLSESISLLFQHGAFTPPIYNEEWEGGGFDFCQFNLFRDGNVLFGSCDDFLGLGSAFHEIVRTCYRSRS